MKTATEETKKHYLDPRIKNIILKNTVFGNGWRALNGDFSTWYRYIDNDVRLLNFAEDYDYLANNFRTLYSTLNVFDPGLAQVSRKKNSVTSENPLGTPEETTAYTLGTDIDKGHGYEIEAVKNAVEDAATFLVKFLSDHGIHDSVWVLFSGGGIYVEVHHEICRSIGDRDVFFEMLTDRFNRMLGKVSDDFFAMHPEHVGKVKFDALNNSKRVFKSIFSIHKKKPYAVVPLNKADIKIDFERAKIPLRDDVIEDAEFWYGTYKIEEREALLKLLNKYSPPKSRKRTSFNEIYRAPEVVEQEKFCPCLQHIINQENKGEGKTRFTGILSAFLYSMGWDEDRSFRLVKDVSDRNEVSQFEHIFDSCYGKISCPSCNKIQTDSAGYPHLGLKGLNACNPDQTCNSCRWPGEYSIVRRRSDIPLRGVSTADEWGSVGVTDDGTVRVVDNLNTMDGPKKYLKWVSDCAVWVDTETRADGKTELTFEGIGANDKTKKKFTMIATDLADPRKFRGSLINAFGGANKVGKLDFETVQGLTRYIKKMKRVEIPVWSLNVPLIPGVDLLPDVEYRLSSMTPARVYDGKLDDAMGIIEKYLGLYRYAPILLTTILGAPAYARWHNNDRFGLALWGTTGTLKTTMIQAAMSIYGTGYIDDTSLLKHGVKTGGTAVGALEVFAGAGILPQILDNVKAVDEKDSNQYISLIQSILEGREKVRGRKEGGLRESRTFYCTPIITGEIKPDEASTSARVLNLPWSWKMTEDNRKDLSHIQKNISLMPVAGYHWLRFLSDTTLNMVDGFDEARGKYLGEFSSKGFVNPGRLATIYTLLRATWNLLLESPLSDAFFGSTELFMASLDEVIMDQGAMVTEETEVERFLAGLDQLITGNPGLLVEENGTRMQGRCIGRRMDGGKMFLLPDVVLSELTKMAFLSKSPAQTALQRHLAVWVGLSAVLITNLAGCRDLMVH